MTIVQQIRNMILTSGKSYRELEDRSDMRVDKIGRIARGKNNPVLDAKLEKLVDAMGYEMIIVRKGTNERYEG